MGDMDTASDELIALVAHYYDAQSTQTDGGPNTDDMIGALAAFAADQLISLCVSPENIKESSRWIIGNEVDDLLYRDENKDTMYFVMTSGSLATGMAPGDLPEMEPIVARASMGDELAAVPFLSVKEHYYPTDWPPNAAVRFRAQVNAILDTHGVKGEDRPVTCAFATAKMIRIATEKYVDPMVPLLIALETVAGMARMTPLQKEID